MDELLANGLKLYTDANTVYELGQRDITQLSYDLYTKALMNYVPIYIDVNQKIYNALNFQDAASKRRSSALVGVRRSIIFTAMQPTWCHPSVLIVVCLVCMM